jgi:hypothetical protein
VTPSRRSSKASECGRCLSGKRAEETSIFKLNSSTLFSSTTLKDSLTGGADSDLFFAVMNESKITDIAIGLALLRHIKFKSYQSGFHHTQFA